MTVLPETRAKVMQAYGVAPYVVLGTAAYAGLGSPPLSVWLNRFPGNAIGLTLAVASSSALMLTLIEFTLNGSKHDSQTKGLVIGYGTAGAIGGAVAGGVIKEVLG